MVFISEERLMRMTPSVFSTNAHEKTSDKYSLIPTIECIRGLRAAGFGVVAAHENKVRDANNRGYAKHMLRFRHENSVTTGGNVPEIVMINSHNGLSSYHLRAGIYRLVCSNGLIAGNDMFYRKLRHQGDVVSKVVEAAGEIIDIIPEVVDMAEAWRGITLNEEQRAAYAHSAALLKWDESNLVENFKYPEGEEAPTQVRPASYLRHKRHEDSGKDLWTTFNVVQENLIKGGVRNVNFHAGRNQTTRAVQSVSENARLNTALWTLTEKMAQLIK